MPTPNARTRPVAQPEAPCCGPSGSAPTADGARAVPPDATAVRAALRGAVARDGASACGDCAAFGYSANEEAAARDGANRGRGCGNPQAIAALRPGEVVLDRGSGDGLLAARPVGPTGRVIGVGMTTDALSRAREYDRSTDAANVELRLGEIEQVPIGAAWAAPPPWTTPSAGSPRPASWTCESSPAPAPPRSSVPRRVPGPDADDVVQGTRLRIHLGIGAPRDDDRLASWVYRVARGAIIDHPRRRPARRPAPHAQGPGAARPARSASSSRPAARSSRTHAAGWWTTASGRTAAARRRDRRGA